MNFILQKCRTLNPCNLFLRSNHDIWIATRCRPHLKLHLSCRQLPLNRITLVIKSNWKPELIWVKYKFNFSKYNFSLRHELYKRITFTTNRIMANHLFLDVNHDLGYKFRMESFLWFEPHRPRNRTKVSMLNS